MRVLATALLQGTSAPAAPYLGAIVMLAMGVLLVVIGFLLAYVLFERRVNQISSEMRKRDSARPPGTPPPPPARSRPAAMVCPACRREYEVGVRYCPHDAKPLVSAEAGAGRAAAGGICPTCKRAFDAGVKFCPQDAEELIPMAFWEATHGRSTAPSGVVGKICPTCSAKYDMDATFCGRDGSELVAVN